MANQAKVKVQIQLDEEEAAKLLKNVDTIANEVGKVGTESTAEAVQQQNNLSKAIKGSIEQYEFEDEQLNELLRTARQLGKDEQFYALIAKKGYTEGIIAVKQMLGLKKQDNSLTKEQIQLINLRATELRHESIALRRGAADLNLFSQAAVVTGTATIASIMLMAKQYSDSLREAEVDASKFAAAQNRLASAKNRIGQVFARESIPFINDMTRIVDKAAQFLERHPEIVPIAIKAGEILVGVGVIGKGIATATRLTADFLAIQSSILRLIAARALEQKAAATQLAAAELMNVAADKQILAGEVQAGASNTSTARTGLLGLGGAAGIGTTIGAGVLSVAAVNIALAKQFDKLEKELPGRFKGIVDYIGRVMTAVPGFPLVQSFRDLEKVAARDIPLLQAFVDKLRGIEEVTGRTSHQPARRVNIAEILPSSVELSEHLDEMLEAYSKYKADDLALVADHYDKRKDIVADGLEAERKENEKYAKIVADIRNDLQRKLADLTRNYERQTAEAERKHALDRAKIIRDAGDDILKIEQELQEKLRKLALEHADKRDELLAARDALGLVKEQRRYQREQDEARREANLEIARRRGDIAQKLADLDREYAEERARRFADYQERIKEAQLAAADRAKAAAEEHAAELKQIREQTIKKLQEEDRRFAEERKRLYNQFVQRLRDLDAFYLGEQRLIRQRHTEMIAELDAFLLNYRSRMKATYTAIVSDAGGTTGSTGGKTGTRAFGGYATFGNYRLGDSGSGGKGPDEFVMSGATTQAAERLIGGRLNQANLLMALAGSKGSGSSITWNDNRRFDSRLSLADRRAIMEDTKQVIREMLT